jgi:hypothetical protein
MKNLGNRPLIVLTAGKMTFTPEPFLTKEIEVQAPESFPRIAGRTGATLNARKTDHCSGQRARHHVRAPGRSRRCDSRGLVRSERRALTAPNLLPLSIWRVTRNR